MESSIKMDDLGVPLFSETPIYIIYIYIYMYPNLEFPASPEHPPLVASCVPVARGAGKNGGKKREKWIPGKLNG